jgi:hypothetical protein
VCVEWIHLAQGRYRWRAVVNCGDEASCSGATELCFVSGNSDVPVPVC